MKKNCKKCGKPFTVIIQWANYCSAECERLAANPVAKFSRTPTIRHKPKKGKGSYDRSRLPKC